MAIEGGGKSGAKVEVDSVELGLFFHGELPVLEGIDGAELLGDVLVAVDSFGRRRGVQHEGKPLYLEGETGSGVDGVAICFVWLLLRLGGFFFRLVAEL